VLLPSSSKRKQQLQQRVLWMLTPVVPMPLSSLASGVVKIAESVTGTGRLCPLSLQDQRSARYALGA